MEKTAIVIGATGLTGTHLVSALLHDGYYTHIRVLVRKHWFNSRPGLESIIVDYSDEATLRNLIKGDVLFCCIGTTIKKAGSKENFRKVDFDIPVRCARIAHENGVGQFLVMSSIGANLYSRNFYLRTKGQLEAAIEGVGFPSVAIFRPSFLIGQRQEFRLGEWFSKYLIQLFYFLLQGRWKKYRGIKAATVASAMLKVAKKNIPGTAVYESDAIQETGETPR
ncbi:NAD(P)H-binding protein [Chitinophaga sp. sic0106]|uniref:NAD(P)H-binding protein n=1 Tax=Chitinophaga sp. sic0106 TaxID=2854785 RepID=UPI001C48E007|nr:NAD(P)H-binding protein [Chitinophaga sp. sic0106]MBV7531140.1 NAD(P)H-binding protein [Chitinophaga sp. sic0106]